jgi:hypothetical protein
MLVDTMLAQGCKYIMFLDSDNILGENDLERLIAHNLPIVSALYFRRHAPPPEPVTRMHPAIWKRAEKPQPGGVYAPIIEFPAGLIEVDVIGVGACLVKDIVFKRIRQLPNKEFTLATAWCNDCLWFTYLMVGEWAERTDTPDKCPKCGSAKITVYKPYFEWTTHSTPLGISEDFNWCEKAKKAGFHILVDTTIRVKHDFSGIVREDGYLGYHAW